MFFEFLLFVYQYDFPILALMGDFCSHVVEIERLSDLIPESSVDWHGLDLTKYLYTLSVMVAPDSRSPNLRCPVVM